MINPLDINIESITLSALKDKNGRFKYDESSEQFGMTVKMQYEVLRDSIEKKGQQVPILIWRDRIVDGRNRCRALNELNAKYVKVRKLPYMMKLEERMELARDTEFARRHQTPTQIACDAVLLYERRTKDGSKVKKLKEAVLKETGASSGYFTSARWIKKHHPTIFNNLWNGGSIILDNPNVSVQSLTAVEVFYKKKIKDAKDEKQARELEEQIAREGLDNIVEYTEDEEMIRNGKLEAYKAIDLAVDPLIQIYGTAKGITLGDYLAYKYAQMKRDQERDG